MYTIVPSQMKWLSSKRSSNAEKKNTESNNEYRREKKNSDEAILISVITLYTMHLIGLYSSSGNVRISSCCFYFISLLKRLGRESLVSVRVRTIRSALLSLAMRRIEWTNKSHTYWIGEKKTRNNTFYFPLKLLYERTKWRSPVHSCHSKSFTLPVRFSLVGFVFCSSHFLLCSPFYTIVTNFFRLLFVRVRLIRLLFCCYCELALWSGVLAHG